MPESGWSKETRQGVWEALYYDNPEMIANHLIDVDTIRRGRVGLWSPDKYHGDKPGKKDTHLLDVMLLQKTGVNFGLGGAVKCYAWLNATFPDAYTPQERERVVRRAEERKRRALMRGQDE